MASSRFVSAFKLLAALSNVPVASGHGWVTEPPARNAQAGPKNGYCPHCGNGNGICGDGNQWPGGSDYLNFYQGPVATWKAGTVVEVEVKITAHHKGHFEVSVCDQVITSALSKPQACLDKWILERASPEEAGLTNCQPGDKRAGCQPIDPRHPERFYLPPPGFSPDGGNTHKFYVKVPAGLKCAACTMQWRWWSANSCIPAPDYGCFASELTSSGFTNVASWGLGGACPGGGCNRCGCGEEFRNCVDITVSAASGEPDTTQPPASTTVAPTTQSFATTTATVPGGGGGSGEVCVSKSVLTCINGKSSFWPKCDPAQAKNVVGPAGYEFGFYCTQEWTDALNEMLSDPVVGKCSDRKAIHKLLAQVAYETGYFSTVYQPRDGGAGLIHMIPGNWPVNAADMDVLFPREGQHYEQIAVAMGKDFFQSPDYGWKSVAAWFKRTNVVIPGCGLDLFDQDFEEQTRCILSRVVSRQEAFDIVGSCLPDDVVTTAPPVVTTTAAVITPAPTAPSPATLSPTLMPTPAMTETTSAAPKTSSAAPSTSTFESVSCRAAIGGAAFGATDARCQTVCQIVEAGSWPCGDGHPCVCDGSGTSSTTPMMPSTTPMMSSTTPMMPSTTSSLRGTTSTTPSGSTPCLANPALNRGVSNSACARCPTGYKWWPCNEAILCIGDCSP
eukprot:TRINITY_DN5363_c1_g1_i1.p1 TRINITY_DN5363_c1_g1~~TRINITY_DN5363_c1_g1_i1.p1  ORF type:complete len:688 (-),score=90.02 TRINITY_DN5363_c1_g1_i1:294-2309(-)